jgi:hypothetical protein
MPSEERLRAKDWEVRTVNIQRASELVEDFHYSAGASNTATYRHGLFPVGSAFERECVGVAWWIPPTRSAAQATYPKNWKGVLALSRLSIHPEAPRNAASFLLGRSMKALDRTLWPCLVTYADTWRGHTGAIYRATNWKYVGLTKPERTYVKDGRLVARKAGPKTRTHAEMLALGAECIGSFPKHKFVHIEESHAISTKA